jgi:hypothetical protein
MNRSLRLSVLALGLFFDLPSCLVGDGNDAVDDDDTFDDGGSAAGKA